MDRSTKSRIMIYFVLIICLFFPTITIGGKNIMVGELLAYILLIHLVNYKKIFTINIHKVYIKYFILYLVIMALSVLTSGSQLDNSNVNVARRIFQSIIYLLFFYKIIFHDLKLDQKDFKSFFFKCLFLLSIPIFITYLQIIDFAGFKLFTYDIYAPTYYSNPDAIFKGHNFTNLKINRVTSIFSDFFTSAVYSVVLSITFFYFLINIKSGKIRRVLILLLLITFISQFFTSRTGLLFIPLSLILFSFHNIYYIRNKKIKKRAFINIVKFLFLFVIVIYILIDKYSGQFTWALKFLSIIGIGDFNEFASIQSSISNNNLFFYYLKNNLYILYSPMHDYFGGYGNKSRFGTTDSFYLQEIFRHGIYGIFIYIYFIIALLKKYGKSSFFFTVIIVLSIINYKGGNTFFMNKNIYIYSFLFVAILYFEQVSKHNFLKGNKNYKGTIHNNTTSLSKR